MLAVICPEPPEAGQSLDLADARRARFGFGVSHRCRAVSDSGSGMGAEGRCHVRSEAVTLPGFTPLTCENVT